MANKDLNRLKVVLVEKHKTAKWLAEQMEKDPATISKWCTNKAQPSLETIQKIAEILQVPWRKRYSRITAARFRATSTP